MENLEQGQTQENPGGSILNYLEQGDAPSNTPSNPEGRVSDGNFAWLQDPEVRKIAELKNFKNADDVVSRYAKLEKLLGGEKIPLPKKDDPASYDAFYEKLGRPKDPTGYDLPAPEGMEPDDYDQTAVDIFRNIAHQAGLSNDQARMIHDNFLSQLNEMAQEQYNNQILDSQRELEALKKEWGMAFDTKKTQAERAANIFFSEEDVSGMINSIGRGQTLKLLAKIGASLGEDNIAKFSNGSQTQYTKSPEMALQEIKKIQGEAFQNKDHPWVNKEHPEHQLFLDRMASLFKMAYPS